MNTMDLENFPLVTFSLVLILFAIWFTWRRKRMSYFSRLGIRGPPPNFITGNLSELNEKGVAACQKEWTEKYGKVLGYYMGANPTLMISDPDLIKQIQVKDFTNFPDRPVIGRIVDIYRSAPNHSVSDSEGRRWKEMRTILTPTFSSGKMKQMMPIVDEATKDLMEIIKQKSDNNEVLNIFQMYQGLTMDVIGRVAFGIRTNVQKNPNDLFLLSAISIFENHLASPLVRLKYYFPEFSFILHKVLSLIDAIRMTSNKASMTGLLRTLSDVIKARRQNKAAHTHDLLQLMIDANVTMDDLKSATNETLTVTEESEMGTPSPTKGNETSLRHYMNDIEIKSNALVFLLAGYETTSSALGSTTHLLAVHQDVQDKLRDEIRGVIEDEGSLNYSNVMNMNYLNQVFCESLRIYSPSLTAIRRTANADLQYKDIFIPKGTIVQIAIWPLHNSPEYWTEPEKFIPERFSSENKGKIKPLTYQPFGSGPRNCIGMRLAQLEAKLALARLLSSYKLILGQEKKDLEISYSLNTTHPKDGVWLEAIPV